MTDEATQALVNTDPDNTEPASCTNTSCCPPQAAPFKRSFEKVGRNDPCPCGNGRKYKKCCGSKV